MDNTKQPVGNKYIILDAKTKEEKKGRYFCLRLDSETAEEAQAVRAAILAYCSKHHELGHADYATRINEWTLGQLSSPGVRTSESAIL